jgi:putative MATE family efflux protein
MADEFQDIRLKQDLTSRPLAATLIGMAAPIAAGTILQSAYALVNAYWLGKAGTTALAAPGAASPFQFIAVAFGMGFANAGTALVAQFTGAKQYERAERAAAQTILVLCSLITVAAVPMVACTPQLLNLFRVPQEAMPEATAYLRIVLIGLPISAFTMAYGGVLRAVGDTVTVIVILAVANIANAALDPFLIFGWVGLPRMGVRGAALGTVICQTAAALACYGCLRRGRSGLNIKRADWKPDWPLIWKTLTVGLPAAIGGSSTSFGFALQQSMVNTLGVVVMAAFTIGFRVIHVLDVPVQAMASATAPIVGQALGAGKRKLARQAAWTSAIWVAAIMFLPLAFVTWQRHLVAGLFAQTPEVVEEAAKFFLLVPVSSYFFGVFMVLTSAFVGSGHTMPTMILAVVRLWVLRIPLVYLFAFVLHMGSTGIYTGMALANVFSAGIALMMFFGIRWESAVVALPARQEEPAVSEVSPERTPRSGLEPGA